jgi:hypothetical protein
MIAELMAGIDDLDADAGGIDVGDAAPIAFARVPGALVLVDQPVDRPVLVDTIMRRDLGLGRGHAVERALAIGHAGVVEDDHRYRQRPLVEIGRRAVDEVHGCACGTFRRTASSL